MQRRLRNTLAIAIAGGALIIGAGTAAAATPADELTSNAPQVPSVSKADLPVDGVSDAVDKPEKQLSSGAEKLNDAAGPVSGPAADLGSSAADASDLTSNLDAPSLDKAPVEAPAVPGGLN